MTVKQGNKRGGCVSRGNSATLLVLTACLFGAVALPLPATGAGSVGRTTADALTSAFAEALGTDRNKEALPYRLEVTRYGQHWLLSGVDAAGETARTLECLLCSDAEAVDAAGRLGAGLGRRHRGEPEGPLFTSSVSTSAPAASSPSERSFSEDSSTSEPRPTTRLRWAAVSALLGGGALAAGGVLVWMDGRCADARCGNYHELNAWGIGVLAFGAVLETTALLLWRLKRKPRAAR